MFSAYQRLIFTRPKLTNFLTTGFLFGAGDTIAQIAFPTESPVLNKSSQNAAAAAAASTATEIVPTRTQQYDFARTARAVIYGSCIFSFIGDKWYRILSKVKFPGSPSPNPKLNAFRNTVARTAVDQLCWAPVGIPLYFTVMSQMEGKSLEESTEKLKENWWPTLTANWTVWPLFQLFNFGLVPVQHQLLAVNVISIAWNTYLSMTNSKNTKKIPQYSPPVPE